MQIAHAANAAAKRYRPVVWGNKRKLPDDIKNRADMLASLFVRESFDKVTDSLNVWMDHDVRNEAFRLIKEYGMVASYGFDGDSSQQSTQAIMFEASVLVHMAAVAVVEQEIENGVRYADDKTKPVMLSVMPLVYKNMIRLHERKANPGDTGFER